MLNCILGVYCVLLPYIAWNISAQFIHKPLGFQKKGFLELKIFSILRNIHILTKVITLSEQSTSKIQVMQHWTLDFAYVSNYLAFKLSAWRRSFTISFELKCHGLHRYYFGRFLPSSCKILPRKVKFRTLQQPAHFWRVVEFPYYFYFKVLQLLYYCYNLSII